MSEGLISILILTHVSALGLGCLLAWFSDLLVYSAAARDAVEGWGASIRARERASAAYDRISEEADLLREENRVLRSVIRDATHKNGVYR